MVEYLIELADRKKLQAIFTTHSNEALSPLPDKAIWAAVNGELFQGKLDIASLRAISGQVDARLVIFVEDNFAKSWVEEILRSVTDIAMDALSVHAMEGDGTAVKVHKYHNINPTVGQPSICLIDGDSKQQSSESESVYRLPGESPESFIYDRVMQKLDDISGQLAVALLRPYEEERKIAEMVRSVRNTNRDPHLLYAQLGKSLGLLPEARVREAFISLWARTYPSEVESIIKPFSGKLPLNADELRLTSIARG